MQTKEFRTLEELAELVKDMDLYETSVFKYTGGTDLPSASSISHYMNYGPAKDLAVFYRISIDKPPYYEVYKIDTTKL